MVQYITIRLQKGNSLEKVSARLKRQLYKALLSEMGRKGGSRSTPAKRQAALTREARKRGETVSGNGGTP